jgi:Skp family chaperone for outer membrane proteins
MFALLAATAFSSAHAASVPSSPAEQAATAALNREISEQNDAALAEAAARDAAYQAELARVEAERQQYQAALQAHEAEMRAHQAEMQAHEA